MYTVVFYKRTIPILISTLQFTKSVFSYKNKFPTSRQAQLRFTTPIFYELHALYAARISLRERAKFIFFYNMTGAKRNRATTFIELIRGGSTPFQASINEALAFYELKMTFEM